VGLVDHFERRDTDGAAGAVDEFDAFGEQVIDAVLDNGVRLTAADFHENPGTSLDAMHLGHEFGRKFAVAVFVEVLHVRVPP